MKKVESSNSSLIIVLGDLNVLDFSAKPDIHATILEEEIYRLVQRLILIIACDIKTFKDAQAVKFWKILPNSASELCCTVPRLEVKSSRMLAIRLSGLNCVGSYTLDGPNCPKGAFKKFPSKKILNLTFH